MKNNITEKLLSNLPLSGKDAARLVLECIEETGINPSGMKRTELLQLLRRVIRHGATALEAEQHTVTFEVAALASVDARSGRRESTKRDLRHFVRRMLRVPNIGMRPLRRMTSEECRNMLQTAFGNSIHSYRKGRTILHSIFAYGLRRQWCSCNPVDCIETPVAQEKEIKPLSPSEVKRLVHTAEKPEHRDMLLPLQLMLYCGVRPTEVTRLQPQDISPQEGELIIKPRVGKTGGGRIVPLRHITAEIGGRIAPRNWIQRWRALRRAAGFTNWVSDVCRHTFASYHAAYFRNLGELQLEMGHRDVTLLRSRYVSPVKRRDARLFWLGT